MPIAFGAPTADGSSMSLDQLLAQLGIGGQAQPPAPQPDAMPQGVDPVAALIAASGGGQAQPQAAPQPQALPPGMNLPPPPTWAHRNVVGDVLDNLFLGGAIQGARGQEYKHEVDTYTRQLQAAALQRQFGAIRSLPAGIPQALATLNPDKFAEEASKSVTTPGGDTTTFMGDPNSRFTAPKVLTDDKSGGVAVATPGQPLQSLGGFGGDFKVDPGSGGMFSGRTGDVSAVLPQFHSAPVTDNAGFNAPPGATIPSVFGGGAPASSAITAGIGGSTGAQPAATASPLPVLSAAIRRLESGGNDAAQNGSSTGRYQFKPSTFNAVLPGGNINNPDDQEKAFGLLTQQNTAALQKAGLPVTDANLYLLHQQGAPGGLAILQNPQKNAVQALTDAGIYQNPATARRAITRNYGTVDMTGSDFANLWAGKMNRAVRRSGGAATPDASAQSDGAAPAASAPGGITSGWQGKGYTTNPDGTVTNPQGKPEAGPKFLDPNGLRGIRNDFAGSDIVKDATNSVTALNGFLDAKSKMMKNGVLDNAAMDSYLRGINPGMGARANSIAAFLEHLGLPTELQSKIQQVVGKDGFLTPQTLASMEQVMRSYAGSHLTAASQRKASDEQFVSRYGYKPEDLSESLPTINEPKQQQGQGNAAQVLGQARDAMQRGAPRAAVIQRLRAMGIDPGAL